MAKSMNDLLNTDVDAIVEKGQEGFRKSRKKAIKTLIMLMVVCVIGAAGYFAYGPIQLWQRYNNAVELMKSGQYHDAIMEFKSLGEYSNSEEMINETRYQRAQKYMEDGKYTYALADLEKLGEYKDSADMINEVKYKKAVEFMENEKYNEAIVAFADLGEYKDSSEQCEKAKEILYDLAIEYCNNEDYDNAMDIFKKLKEYKDSEQQVKTITDNQQKLQKYNNALTLLDEARAEKNFTVNQDKTRIYQMFVELGDYKDSELYVSNFSYLPISIYRGYERYNLYYNSEGLLELKNEYDAIGLKEHRFAYDEHGSLVKEIVARYDNKLRVDNQEIEYIYDEEGKLIQKKTTWKLSEHEPYIDTKYIYNDASKCVEEISFNPSGIENEHKYYEYDSDGNRISCKTISDSFFSKEKETALYHYSYEFDEEGNCIKEVKTQETWNNAKVEKKPVTTEYIYGYLYIPDKKTE